MLPSKLGSVADDPESDVEDDPFAEFTVMDGLEDLDEMLADKQGGGSLGNMSNGNDPSESLATGAVGSMQPAYSDAMQSEELPDAVEEAIQPMPAHPGVQTTCGAGEVHTNL